MNGSRVCAKGLAAAALLVISGGFTTRAQDPTRGPSRNQRADGQSVEARAARIHREAIVFDGHIDVVRLLEEPGWKFTDRHPPNNATEDHVDLPRMKEGGLTGGFFAIDDNDQITGAAVVEDSLRHLDVLGSLAEQMPDHVVLCLTADDVRRAKAAGKIAMMLAIEGGHMINDSLPVLRNYARLGVRSMSLTHFVNTSWADASSQKAAHNGLTDFGRQVVREMNRLGLIVDVSHTSDETFYAALEASQAPIFASHSSARALFDHPRNITDAMMKALAAKGGVIAINFHAGFLETAFTQARQKLTREVGALRKDLETKYPPDEVRRRVGEALDLGYKQLPKVPWTLVVDHIDHAVKLVGADHVALGSDFNGGPMPDGLDDASYYPRITQELLRRGYGESDIKKILGGNTLRLLDEVASISRKLRAQATN